MGYTVKVICYKSKILSNGESPLMLRICKDRKMKYRSIGVSLNPKYWDFNKNLPKPQCPNREQIIMIMDRQIHEINESILQKKIEGKEFTASSIVDSLSNINSHTATIGAYYLNYIESLKADHRLRYAGMFQVSYNSFVKFAKTLEIPFSDIDKKWLSSYVRWATKQMLSINTIGTRLRHLRVIYNIAKDEHIIKSDEYPFDNFKVAKYNEKTAKRALTKDNVIAIMNYVGTSPMEKLAVDLFTFSYLEAGINFIDIAKLKKTDIVDNRIIYTRSKTKKTITIPLQAKAKELIIKHDNPKSEYVFPILSSFHKTDVQVANRLHKVLAEINGKLKDIGKKLEIPITVTTYVARHSFATILKRSGVTTSIISESLGHSSERITQTYLDSFDNTQIANAMENLL